MARHPLPSLAVPVALLAAVLLPHGQGRAVPRLGTGGHTTCTLVASLTSVAPAVLLPRDTRDAPPAGIIRSLAMRGLAPPPPSPAPAAEWPSTLPPISRSATPAGCRAPPQR